MPEDGTKGFDAMLSGGFRAAHTSIPMPKPGEIFAGRYTIRRLVGRGGMGEVYLATQAPLDRMVALKILKPPESIEDDPNFDARFLREAAAAARLQHPNTITVYDFGQTDDGQLYIVMEYLEGTDVRTTLAHEGIFSAQRAIHVAKQVCKSLREAHAKGIIHRDLKPANVLLIERDDDVDFVKVLDFGLVKFRGEASEITLAGKFLGSPRYTSPEALDRNAIVDHRADIYAIGILLYTMLTGTPPFDGDPMQVLNAHLHEIPKAMYRLNPAAQTTPELEGLVMKCLEKKPADRFDTMADVLAALREVGAYFGDEYTETLDLELSDSGQPGSRGVVGGVPTPTDSGIAGLPGHSVTTSERNGKIVVEVNVGGNEASTVTRRVPPTGSAGRGSNRGLIAAIAVLLLLAGTAAAVLLTLPSGEDEIEMPAGTVQLDRDPAPDPSPEPAGLQTVSLEVQAAVDGSTVSWRDGDEWTTVGASPATAELELPAGATSLLVRIEEEGQAARTTEVTIQDGVAKLAEPRPTPAPIARPAPAKPRPRGPSPPTTTRADSGSQTAATKEPTPAPKDEGGGDDEGKPDLPVGYKDNPY